MFRAGAQPPDEASGNDQPDRDELCSRHSAAEDGTPAGIVADEFQKEPGHSVDEHKCADDLAIKFLALEQPHQDEKISKLDRRFKQLCGFKWYVQGRAGDGVRERITEDDTPPMMSWFAVATSGGETTETANGVTKSEPRGEGITRTQRGHVMLPDVPCGCYERQEQASRENASSLKRVDAEDFRGMSGVVAPFVDYVEHLGAQDAAKDYENAEIPGVVAVVSEALRVTHADPEA